MTYGTVSADIIQSSVPGVSLGAGDATMMKNRIINGAMVIDQRNAGASVTANNGVYGVDRFSVLASQTGKLNIQQNAGSVTPPAGFSNYVGFTSTSAYSLTSTDYFQLNQVIEGYNIADLNWGTANAKTVTLSFWVYSSLTGTFSGALFSSSFSYGYAYTYTINSANTWQQISITITGPTVASWNTTNGAGINLRWAVGLGSSLTGAPSNTWNAGASWSSVGTSVVGTNGATFYITGVQLEVGSSATGFEYRQYGQELALCQRYYTILGSGTPSNLFTGGYYSSGQAEGSIAFPVTMRTAPSLVQTSGSAYYQALQNGNAQTFSSFSGAVNQTTQSMLLYTTAVTGTQGTYVRFSSVTTSASIAVSAEL